MRGSSDSLPTDTLLGPRIRLRSLYRADAAALCAYYLRNREFFREWDPVRPEEFFTLQGQRRMIDDALAKQADDRGYRFAVVPRTDGPYDPTLCEDEIVGVIGLNNVVRGVFQNADLGFSLDAQHTGRGLMTEAVRTVIAHAFQSLNLHRLQAAVQPHNAKSLAVLARAGFRPEGEAKRYLKINGDWRDHLIFAITAD